MEEESNKLSENILNVEFYLKEINFLKERLENLTDTNFHLKEENLSLSNQVEIKFQESIFKAKKIEALQNENIELTNKIEDITKNNLTLQNDNLRFLDLKKFSEERENNLKNQINEQTIINDNLREDLNKEKIHTMTLNSKISEMEKIINILQKDLNLSVTEKNMLKYRNEQVESQLKLAGEESLFNQNIQNNEKKLFEQNKIQLNNKIVALNDEISILNQNNLIKTNQIEMRLKAFERDNEEFKLENKDLIKKLEIKEKNISELFELINKIQNELKTKESLIRFLEDLVNEKEEIIISRKTKIIEITKELDMFRNTEKKLLSSEISFKGRELFNDEIILKRENEKLKQELDIFCSKYNKIIEENNQLKLKLKTADQEKMDLEELNQNMTEKSNQLELTFKLLEQDKNDYFNQNALLSKQNRELMLRFNLINDKTLVKRISDQDNYEHLISCKVDEYEINLNRMICEIEKMKEIINYKEETINELNKIIDSQKQEILDIEEKYKTIISEEIKAIDLESKKYTIRTYNLTDPNISLENYKKLQQNNQELLHEKYIMNEKLNEYISKLSIYENDLIETNNKNLTLKKDLIDKEKTLMSQNYEIEKLFYINNENKEKISFFEKNMEFRNAEINTLRQENFNLNSEKISFREKLDNLFLESNNKLSQIQKTFDEKVEYLVKENNGLKDILIKFFNANEVVGDINQLSQSTAVQNYIENIRKQNELVVKKDAIINNLNQQILEFTLQIENLQTFNSNLKAKLEITENQLKTLTKSIYQHKQSVNVGNEFSKSINECNEIDDQFDKKVYEKYLNSLKQIDENIIQMNYLKSKINELENFNKDLINNNYHSSYKFLLMRIEEFNIQNDELRTKLSKLNTESENFNKTLVELKIEKDNLLHQRTNYEQELSLLRNKLLSAEKLTQNKENHIQELNNLLNESKKKDLVIANLEKEKENLSKFLSELVKEINNSIKEVERVNSLMNSEKESFSKEMENLKNMNKIQIEEINKNKDLNGKSFSEREKELKDEYEKKVIDARNKSFNQHFAVFRKSRNLIESLLNIEKSLREKIYNLEDNSKNMIPLAEYKSKIATHENQIISFKKRIKDLELTLDDKNKKFNNEIELIKTREEKLLHELKLIKNYHENYKSEDAKPENDQKSQMINRLLKSLYTATNVITALELNDKTMKADIERLKGEVDKKNVPFSCDNCTCLKEENRHLNDVVSNLKNQISKDKNELGKLSNKVLKSEIEKNIVIEDCKVYSNLINRLSSDTHVPQIDTSDKSKMEIEKNKNFGLMLVYLKKSSKMINALSEEIRILQGKVENVK